MKKKVIIKGMHCDACKALVRMELDEIGLEENIEEITILGENKGILILDNVSGDKLTEAVEAINNAGQYKVESYE